MGKFKLTWAEVAYILWVLVIAVVIAGRCGMSKAESICYDPITNTWYDAQVCSTTSTTSTVPECPERICERVCRWQQDCTCDCSEVENE